MKKTLKQIVILVAGSTIISFSSCNYPSTVSDMQEEGTPAQASTNNAISSSSSSNDSQDEFVGTFRFTDGGGSSYTLSVKSDETVTLSGNGNTFYGSWDKRTAKYTGYATLFFSNPTPNVTSDKVVTKEHTLLYGGASLNYSAVKNGYLYFSADDAKANNPNNRIAIR